MAWAMGREAREGRSPVVKYPDKATGSDVVRDRPLTDVGQPHALQSRLDQQIPLIERERTGDIHGHALAALFPFPAAGRANGPRE